MANLRIIYDNAVDRATTLTASTTAGSLAASNLTTDIKSDVWRSTGTSATLTVVWSTAETVGGVFLPFCDLTAQATIQVLGYTEAADAVALFDTGAVEACPAPIIGLWGWGSQSLGANAFAYGGGTYGRVWIPIPGAVKKIVINIADSTNPAGYIEAGRLVCGAYWSPVVNAGTNASITAEDTSKHYRNEAGDLMTDTGTQHRKQSFSLSGMSPSDRSTLWDILRGNGLSKPVLFSLYPEDSDASLEQTHQIYGKRSNNPATSSPYFQKYASSLELEEI